MYEIDGEMHSIIIIGLNERKQLTVCDNAIKENDK